MAEQPQSPLIFSAAKAAAAVGLGTGIAGGAIGGAVGLFKSSTPGFFALASGITYFTLGTSFTASRIACLEALSQVQKRPVSDLQAQDRRIASAFAGAGAGALIATVNRGRGYVLPGIVVWGGLGLGGQYLIDAVLPRLEESRNNPNRPSLIDRITTSKWSPITKLSDEEYEQMLKERLLRVEAEIALVEEDIAKLRD